LVKKFGARGSAGSAPKRHRLPGRATREFDANASRVKCVLENDATRVLVASAPRHDISSVVAFRRPSAVEEYLSTDKGGGIVGRHAPIAGFPKASRAVDKFDVVGAFNATEFHGVSHFLCLVKKSAARGSAAQGHRQQRLKLTGTRQLAAVNVHQMRVTRAAGDALRQMLSAAAQNDVHFLRELKGQIQLDVVHGVSHFLWLFKKSAAPG
jgi:hypothetical protein